MSELKALVDALRGMSDQDLRSLVATRLVSLNNIDDFYSLAEALNSSKSYSAIVGALSRTQLSTLSKIAKAESVTDSEFDSLQPLLLAYRVDEKVFTFENLLDQLKQHRAFTRALMVVPEPESAPDQATIDKNAGLAVFETMQALTELVFDVEKHFIREVGKGGVGLPDVKRLATSLGVTNERAKATYALAERLGFTSISQSRHFLTSKALKWLELDQTERLKALIEHALILFGIELRRELARLNAGSSLKLWLVGQFPLAELTTTSRIGQLVSTSEKFGLCFEEHTTSWFQRVMEGATNYSELFGENLPKVQDRLIVQADASVIAPGPLSIALEAKLRKFANTESIGLASTYRLTNLSVCHALELGLTIEEISAVLKAASGKDVPQPLSYLLNEVANRFGKLVIIEAERSDQRTLILSSDEALLTEIGNDQRLRPFSLSRPGNDRLACRFEPSVVYFGLRECGYLAIRKDIAGKIVSPLETTSSLPAQTSDDRFVDAIERIRNADGNAQISGNDESLTRQVQLAIRNKAKLSITVRMPDGKLTVIEIVPSAIANGRLRGRDQKAQVERTLPLSTVETISLA